MLSSLAWTERRFARDKMIVRERESVADAILVREGVVCHQVAGDTGQRQICSLHFAGDLINLEGCFLGWSLSGIQALSPARVASCPRDDFLKFLETRKGAARAVWVAALADSAEARLQAINLSRKSAVARVANLLCQLAYRLEGPRFERNQSFTQPLSQKQIGDATALTSIHVNRVLRSLTEERLIERDGNLVRVPDVRALAQVGGFDRTGAHQLRDEAATMLSLVKSQFAPRQRMLNA